MEATTDIDDSGFQILETNSTLVTGGQEKTLKVWSVHVKAGHSGNKISLEPLVKVSECRAKILVAQKFEKTPHRIPPHRNSVIYHMLALQIFPFLDSMVLLIFVICIDSFLFY